jgi:hypothetical protein
VHQLVEQSSDISPQTLSLYQKHTSASPQTRPSLEEYEDTLKREFDRFKSIYVIVDALDECRDNDGEELQLDTRSRLIQTLRCLGHKIHLLITSRNESLPATFQPDSGISFRRMKVSATKEDIEAYIDARIANNSFLTTYTNPPLVKEIKEIIADKAAGM